MLPWNRPDEEYTSGVHITYDGGRAPWWARVIFGRAQACTIRVTECRTARAELGQDIYTPRSAADDPHAAPARAPTRGWLYFESDVRESLREDRSDELTITLGVTGPPSLARFTQRLAHSAAPEFNRPTDWTRQIGFEPGAIVQLRAAAARWQRSRQARSASMSLPSLTSSAGNVLTAAEIGFQSRVGWTSATPVASALRGAGDRAHRRRVSARGVARDIFLDGNTSERQLARRPRAVRAVGRARRRASLSCDQPDLPRRVLDASVRRRTEVAPVGVDRRRRHLRSLTTIRIKRSSFGYSRSM